MMVTYLQEKHQVSQRRACRVLDQSRSTQVYQPKRADIDRPVVNRMIELADKHPRYGYRRITALMRREGWKVNRKRIYRLWRKSGRQIVRKKKVNRKVGDPQHACHLLPSQHPHDVWSYDFLFDHTSNGQPLKILVVMDEYTRQCLSIKVNRKIKHTDIWETLRGLFVSHGVPKRLRSDNGSEFLAYRLKSHFETHGISSLHIAPGSPWQNGFVESFNAHFKDECLNREVFDTLLEAQVVIEHYRLEYNQQRPHSSLGYLTPVEFEQQEKLKHQKLSLHMV